jgi:hypothetical protein
MQEVHLDVSGMSASHQQSFIDELETFLATGAEWDSAYWFELIASYKAEYSGVQRRKGEFYKTYWSNLAAHYREKDDDEARARRAAVRDMLIGGGMAVLMLAAAGLMGYLAYELSIRF